MPVINNLSLFLAAALVVAITPGPGILGHSEFRVEITRVGSTGGQADPLML
jgi:hypothetical protein